MMKTGDYEKLTEHDYVIMAMGYEPREPCPRWMRSYSNGEKTVTHYFTTGTFQVKEKGTYANGKVVRNPTREELAELL